MVMGDHAAAAWRRQADDVTQKVLPLLLRLSATRA
jgi:hypothetical protein